MREELVGPIPSIKDLPEGEPAVPEEGEEPSHPEVLPKGSIVELELESIETVEKIFRESAPRIGDGGQVALLPGSHGLDWLQEFSGAGHVVRLAILARRPARLPAPEPYSSRKKCEQTHGRCQGERLGKMGKATMGHGARGQFNSKLPQTTSCLSHCALRSGCRRGEA